MAADSSVVTAISGGASSVKDTVISAGTTVLPYAAALLALSAGWRFAKRFVKP